MRYSLENKLNQQTTNLKITLLAQYGNPFNFYDNDAQLKQMKLFCQCQVKDIDDPIKYDIMDTRSRCPDDVRQTLQRDVGSIYLTQL